MASPVSEFIREAMDRQQSWRSAVDAAEAKIAALDVREAELRVEAARQDAIAAYNAGRPSILLGAELSQVVNQATGRLEWCASFGELFAKGHTPDAAFLCFDEAWTRGQL